MSTRWYPLFRQGNPQLRVFLPNFWMKMIKPKYEDYPKNKVRFEVSMGMSAVDVRNYLETIYKVPVVNVYTRIVAGRTKSAPKKLYIIKEDDFKVAYVTLPKDMQFEFPDLFSEEKKTKEMEDERKQLEQLSTQRDAFVERNKAKGGLPGWFT